MVRAPCCEKMGLKKGPWTQEEDHTLVAYIQKYGHSNWRALPKQAGLMRCGKSCRLRWTNYLRPDIKRGNFSKEEEDTIITLHEMLGNRWSVIAGRLPGRTDNEIKNVWHTHLKKRVKQYQGLHEYNRKTRCKPDKVEEGCNAIALQLNSSKGHPELKNTTLVSVSPAQSYSDFSCSGTDSSILSGENNAKVKEERIDSSEEIPEIDESFWSEALSIDNSMAPIDFTVPEMSPSHKGSEPFCSVGTSSDDMSYWLRIFMEARDLQDLPDI